MARGDITILENSALDGRGGRLYNVAAGTAILAGEPVQIRAVGGIVVEPSLTSTPVVSSTAGVEGLFVGIASTDSTNTASAAGTVNVIPTSRFITWLVNPATAAAWDTAAEYAALVGKRVLLQNSTTVSATAQNVGSYTVLASDSAYNAVVVQAFDVMRPGYLGKVAVAFRDGCSCLA